MEKRGIFTKILAILGTILVWFPIQAPLLLAAIKIVQTGQSRIDYLMPAELFPVALAGGVLLIWAAWRAKAQQKNIAWSLGVALAALVCSQALAVASGLASGVREPAGFWWALVVALLAAYDLGLVIAGVGGVLLLLDLFRRSD